jgi:hypothetical protein
MQLHPNCGRVSHATRQLWCIVVLTFFYGSVMFSFGCGGKDAKKQDRADTNKNRIFGKWQCPPEGSLPGGKEQGPTQIILEFDPSGLAKMQLNVGGPAGGKSTTEGTYRISPIVDGVLTTDLLARGEPIKFEFQDDHLILTVPNEEGTSEKPGTMKFRRISNGEGK